MNLLPGASYRSKARLITNAATVRGQLGNICSSALDLLLPRRCALCHQPNESINRFVDESVRAPVLAICQWCLLALPQRLARRCTQCAIALPKELAGETPSAGSASASARRLCCQQCRNRAPAFDASFTLADYGPPLDKLIHRFKYRHQHSLAGTLGNLMATEARPLLALPAWPEVLVPVPMTPGSLARRGYNQSVLLCRVIAQAWRVQMDTTTLQRATNTGSQTGKSRGQRLAGNEQRFIANPLVRGKRVAVIDDVMTSGATLQGCALALKRAGAARVVGIVAARTPH